MSKEEKWSDLDLSRVKDLLRKYSTAFGVPGYEYLEISDILREDLSPLVQEITSDGLGSVIGVIKSPKASKSIMISAHIDQIGFMVSHVDDKGFIRFIPLGGWDERTLVNRVVKIALRGDDGKLRLINGVIGTKPPHLLTPQDREKPHKLKEMFIDIGASSREDVEKLGIRKGSVLTLKGEFLELTNNRVSGQAFDDRVGVVVMLRALELLRSKLDSGSELNVNVYAVGTVQEEVGLRGAKVASFKVSPDYGVAIDVTIAADTPGSSDHEKISELGKGPVLTLIDRSFIASVKMYEIFKGTAEELGIPYQVGVMAAGGTDSGAIHLTKEGVPSITLSIPTRYIHSTVETLDLRDVELGAILLSEALFKF